MRRPPPARKNLPKRIRDLLLFPNKKIWKASVEKIDRCVLSLPMGKMGAAAEKEWLTSDKVVLLDDLPPEKIVELENLISQQHSVQRQQYAAWKEKSHSPGEYFEFNAKVDANPIKCPKCERGVQSVTEYHYKDYRGKCSGCKKICIWRQIRNSVTE